MNAEPKTTLTLELWRSEQFILRGPNWNARQTKIGLCAPRPSYGPYWFEAHDSNSNPIYLSCELNSEGLRFDGNVKIESNV